MGHLRSGFFWQPLAQPQKSPVFDVASVKPHPGASPGTMMRESPGSVNYIGIPLMSVIARAWDVEGFRCPNATNVAGTACRPISVNSPSREKGTHGICPRCCQVDKRRCQNASRGEQRTELPPLWRCGRPSYPRQDYYAKFGGLSVVSGWRPGFGQDRLGRCLRHHSGFLGG